MNDTDDILPAGRMPTMQIIAGALIMGVVSFLGVALFLVHQQRQGQGMVPPRDLAILSLMAVVMAVTNIPLSFIVPSLVARAAVARIGADSGTTPVGSPPKAAASVAATLLGVWQTSMIIGMAL